MLQSKEYKLDINDEKQTIQGVYVSDKAMYLELRGVIEASHLEGWNPTKKDVESVLDGVLNPDPEEVKEIMEIWQVNITLVIFKKSYEFFDHSHFDYAEKNIKDIIHGQPKQVSLEADYLNY